MITRIVPRVSLARPLMGCALAALCACAAPVAEPPASRAAPMPGTPVAEHEADGTCRVRETTPAVYEQVMGEVQVVQAEIAEDGTVLRPPVYRKAPVPRVVRPRAEISFAAPCPEEMTPEFLSSVQRALTARGYFTGPVSGSMDAATAAAVRRYQSERGLESARLSVETARDLGLIAVERDPL